MRGEVLSSQEDDKSDLKSADEPGSADATLASERGDVLPASEDRREAILTSLVPIVVLFAERVFFLWMVYYGKNDLWTLLTATAVVRLFYYWARTGYSEQSHKAELLSVFHLNRAPSVSIFVVIFLAYSPSLQISPLDLPISQGRCSFGADWLSWT